MGGLKHKIANALGTFWDERLVLKVTPAAGTTGEMAAALDSLSASEVLMDIDDIVGKKVSADEVIRRGGYESREQFVDELTSAILKHVEQASS